MHMSMSRGLSLAGNHVISDIGGCSNAGSAVSVNQTLEISTPVSWPPSKSKRLMAESQIAKAVELGPSLLIMTFTAVSPRQCIVGLPTM